MMKIAVIFLALAATTSLCAQVVPSASGGDFGLDDTQMMTPPPVSGDAYPVMVGSEARSNFFSGGLVLTTAYLDNLMLINGQSPTADETYSILPTIGLDRKTTRQGETLSYSSGFTFYQSTRQLNSVAQQASAGYRFHINPYAVIVLKDSFQQNSNLYNQANPFSGGGVSGAAGGGSNGPVIAPLQNQLANSSSAGINYQYGRNAMIGGTGSYTFLNYSNSAFNEGLGNEGSVGANGFFSRRLSRSQYVGATYEFAKFVTHPIDTYTVSHTGFGFYTIYFTRSFSLSVLGGPEHYTTWSSGLPSQGSWTPAVQGSVGWQSLRTSLAATFAHIVSGAGGLIGTYHSDLAGLTGRYVVSRMWSVGASANYSLFKNVDSNPSVAFGSGGHSLYGSVYTQRRITEKINAEAGYGHFHQSYAGIPAAALFPDSNRVYGSIMYEFNRPLGR